MWVASSHGLRYWTKSELNSSLSASLLWTGATSSSCAMASPSLVNCARKLWVKINASLSYCFRYFVMVTNTRRKSLFWLLVSPLSWVSHSGRSMRQLVALSLQSRSRKSWILADCPLSSFTRTLACAMVLRVGIPFSVKSFWKHLHRHTQRFCLLGDCKSCQVDRTNHYSCQEI